MSDGWIRFNDNYYYYFLEETGYITIRDMTMHKDIVLPAQMINQIAKRVKAYNKVRTV